MVDLKQVPLEDLMKWALKISYICRYRPALLVKLKESANKGGAVDISFEDFSFLHNEGLIRIKTSDDEYLSSDSLVDDGFLSLVNASVVIDDSGRPTLVRPLDDDDPRCAVVLTELGKYVKYEPQYPSMSGKFEDPSKESKE